MGKATDVISDALGQWLIDQPVFFVSSAPLSVEGSINCSPKGNRGEFAVLAANQVAYVDQTGSGIETIAHLRENGRIVVMFCAFSGPPRIVRLHGTGRAVEPDDPEFAQVATRFSGANGVGVRSLIVIDVRRVADSCGYGVPLMGFESHRPTMDQWSTRKGTEGIREYQRNHNHVSIDGIDGLSVDEPHSPAGHGSDDEEGLRAAAHRLG